MTLFNKNKEVLTSLLLIKKQYDFNFFRLYQAQMKFEGTEDKRWSYLLICQLSDESNENKVLKELESTYQKEMIRLEILSLTPDSFLQKTPPVKGMDVIEFVNVQSEQLNQFREIMIHNNTPAMSYIIKNKKWCNEFIALETSKVIFHNNEYQQWNQIHMIEMTLLAPLVYKKDFSEGLASVNAPDFETNFNQLKSIRDFTYKYKCKIIN